MIDHLRDRARVYLDWLKLATRNILLDQYFARDRAKIAMTDPSERKPVSSDSPPSTETPRKGKDSDDGEIDKGECADEGDEDKVCFTVATRLCVQKGDWAWVPEISLVQDRQFAKLHAKSRSLAKVIGLDVNRSAPFKDYCGLQCLRLLRNKHIDDIVTTSLKCDISEVHHRERAFKKAKVPLIIDVELPQKEKLTVAMLSTPNRGRNIELELTDELVMWLQACVDKTLADMVPEASMVQSPAASSSWSVGEELPELPPPFKYRKRGSTISITRDFTDARGRTHSLQRKMCMSSELQQYREHCESLIPNIVESIKEAIDSKASEQQGA